jgi:CubicO group peptidase (beta-lactamase class C family)
MAQTGRPVIPLFFALKCRITLRQTASTLLTESNRSNQRMTLVLFLCALLVCPLGLAAQSHSTSAVPQKDRSGQRVVRGRAGDLDAYFAAFAAARDFAGVVLVSHNDTVIATRAFGDADSRLRRPNVLATPFPIASLTKAITAAAILILDREGRLRLSDSLRRFIPEYPEAGTVTLRQLLTHRSGVPEIGDADFFTTVVSDSSFLRRLRARPMAFAPGTDDSYSNEGYRLLAMIVSRAAAEPYERFVERRLFQPLGMRSSGPTLSTIPHLIAAKGYSADGRGRLREVLPAETGMLGAGSAFATAADLGRFASSMARGTPVDLGAYPYPYGWGKRTYLGHAAIEQTGSLEGFNSYMANYPADGYTVIVLSNVMSGMFQAIGKDIAAILFGGTPSTPPAYRVTPLSRSVMRDYAGTYTCDGIGLPVVIALTDRILGLTFGEYPFKRALTPVANDTFFYRAEYATLRFARDSSGTVRSFTFQAATCQRSPGDIR